MAGDWLKVEEAMPDKPEVFAMAAALDIDPDAVAGKLLRVWSWASRNCYGDGVTTITSKRAIDRAAGVAGFADAMIAVDWLTESGNELRFPNFDRHNSKTAKDRALTFTRMQKYRGEASRSCDAPVTEASRSARNENVTKEKRREEVKETASAVSRTTRFVKPTVDEVRAYCSERKNRVDPVKFIDHYEASGWKRGNTPIKDWKACVRTWEGGNDRAGGNQPNLNLRHAEDVVDDGFLVAGEGEATRGMEGGTGGRNA